MFIHLRSVLLRSLPAILFFSVCIINSEKTIAQDTLKNIPELSLPLLNNKLVIAHCMTNIIRFQGRTFEDGCNPNYYPSANNASSSIGGYTQVNVMCDRYLKDSTLDQAVEFEMRAAIRCGIDGFQFYYPLGQSSWDNFIKAYFRVAAQKNLDFKFTFAISHPGGSTEANKITEYANRINGIINEVGRNNAHWLRTPDGRLIMYSWYGEQLADIPANLAGLPRQFYEARAFRKLGDRIGEKIALVYSINDNISAYNLDRVLDYFPAVWLWTNAYTFSNLDATVATACAARTRAYTGSAFPDFYTSKILQPGTWNILSVASAVSSGISHIERKYMKVGLSYTFRKQLDFAIAKNVPIINVITWNDYPEGHHLAPEVNHNYGFSVLLNYYKSIWKGTVSPYSNRDVAIAFFKKYKSNVIPSPYNVPAINIGNTTTVNYEDSIEVVTILPSAGQLNVNGQTVNMPAGISSQRFTHQPGPVKVTVLRNGIRTKSFQTPEWITATPYRTDRLTYTYDTEYPNFHHDIFGDSKAPIYSLEYNADPLNPLPVTLLKFNAALSSHTAQLQWKTSAELNLAWFNVQRSTQNGSFFSTIERVNATGNLSTEANYSISDNLSGINSGNIYYRLQMVDKDGAISYSEIKTVHIIKKSAFNISPNPAKGMVTIEADDLQEIKLVDLSGKLLINREAINNSVLIDITALQAGIYMVIGKDSKGESQSKKLFVKD